MPTPYIDRAKLADLVGSKSLQTAEQQLGANIEAVISAACATADGYVRKQVALPPTPEAISQVAPLVAELVFTALYANSTNAELTKRREAAMRALRDIASGALVLHTPQPVDDPATPEDESAGSGPAFGASPRRMGRSQLGDW